MTASATIPASRKPRVRTEPRHVAMSPPPCPIYLVTAWADAGQSGAETHRVVALRSILSDCWRDGHPVEPEMTDELLVVAAEFGHCLASVEDMASAVNVVHEVLVDPTREELAAAAARLEAEARRKFLGEGVSENWKGSGP